MGYNILIIGHGGHGKDEVAKIIGKHFGLSYCSSSQFALVEFMWDELKDEYETMEECYEDRNSSQKMRDRWYKRICEYNKDDRAKLSKELFRKNDVYVGMRDLKEFEACMKIGLFDLVIWVDAYKRTNKKEKATSFKLKPEHADVIIDNNGTVQELANKVRRLFRLLTNVSPN